MTITDPERQRLIGGSDIEPDITDEYPAVIYRQPRSGLFASILGMLAGLGMLTVLVVVVSSIALVSGVELDLVAGDLERLSIAGVATGATILVVSCFVGGFVAGRVARYGGMVTGVGSTLWLFAILAGFGGLVLLVNEVSPALNGFDLASRLEALDDSGLELAASIAAGTLLLLGMVTGLLGGRMGEVESADGTRVVDIRD